MATSLFSATSAEISSSSQVERQINKDDYDKGEPTIIPSWLCIDAKHEAKPNMHFVSMEVDGVKFKALQNSKAIKVHDQLRKPNEKPPKKKAKTSK